MSQLLWRCLSTVAVVAGVALIVGCGGGQARSNMAQGRGRGEEECGTSQRLRSHRGGKADRGRRRSPGRPDTAWLSPAGKEPVVIFLHAWGPPTPLFYEEWMSHLVGDGVTVIFPAYQSTALATLPQNVQTSVRAALKRLSVAPSLVVVAGDTTGAALAIDYAASAAAAGLPPACAVYGVFPGVNLGAKRQRLAERPREDSRRRQARPGRRPERSRTGRYRSRRSDRRRRKADPTIAPSRDIRAR